METTKDASNDAISSNIDICVPNKTLIDNSELKIIHKHKYGLIGKNGSGKSTLLQYIQNNFEKNMTIFLVGQEFNFDSNKCIYDIVSDANFKRIKLEEQINKLEPLIESDEVAFEAYGKLVHRLKDIGLEKDESIIRKILFGLGFDNNAQSQPFSSFSGGWRMRVALARGLYMQPQLLLLDEPTNHLDINSVIWLTDYLKTKWKKTLVIVSHDIHFINQICNKIMHIENKKLNYYNGNYTSFKHTYNQNNSELEKQWNKIQRRVKEMRNKSTKKDIVDKFIKDNAHFEPITPYKVNMKFYETDPIKSPYINLINITGGYGINLFQNINLCIGAGEKITIVGKNGVGKSTLLQLISGNKSVKFTGEFEKNPNVKIGYYNQHLTDILPLDKTPIEYLVQCNPQIDEFSSRKYLGSIGLEGQVHTRLLSTLSGGQKARVALALINSIKPHILLLDEPTNHLDIESIEAITLAINNFNGSVIMITHNIDIIESTKSKILKLENLDLIEVNFDDYYDDVLNEVENI